jgi:hypothetical protein
MSTPSFCDMCIATCGEAWHRLMPHHEVRLVLRVFFTVDCSVSGCGVMMSSTHVDAVVVYSNERPPLNENREETTILLSPTLACGFRTSFHRQFTVYKPWRQPVSLDSSYETETKITRIDSDEINVTATDSRDQSETLANRINRETITWPFSAQQFYLHEL